MSNLVAIPEVVPNTVETTSDGAKRIEEGVAAPDEKYSVLLSEGLTC